MNPRRIMGGYDGWSGGIAFGGIEMMFWGWLRWGRLFFGGAVAPLGMLLRDWREDYKADANNNSDAAAVGYNI